MKKSWKIFLLFTKYSLKTSFQNPLGVFLFMIGKLLRFATFFIFIYYLLVNTKILVGYSLPQTIIFYLTYSIIDSLAQLFFREVYRFRALVINAEFDTILVKPYHPFLRILVGGLDIMDAFITLLYIGLLGYFISQVGGISGLQIFGYAGFIVNSFLIAASFHIAVLALAIVTTEVDHTIMIYRDMTKMASFPIDIYVEPIRTIFTFVIPVGIMMSFPAKSLFGLLEPQLYVISFAISMIAFFGSLKLWTFALRKYQSWGG